MVEQINVAQRHYLNLCDNLNAENQRQPAINGIRPVDPVFWTEIGAFGAAAVSAIENSTGRDSTYSQQARRCVDDIEHGPASANPARFPSTLRLKGILDQVQPALMSGNLVSYEERIHGEVFGDFLEMADYLLNQGYKDAAAVIAGTALEEHLRVLCKKHSIPITFIKGDEIQPKKASTMNDDLKKANVYGGLEHKQINAWQDLRNKAAHGEYAAYDKQQVALLVQGVRDFIAKYLA